MQTCTPGGETPGLTFTGTGDAGSPLFTREGGNFLEIRNTNPDPWLTIDRIDADSGYSCKPIQVRVVRTATSLTVNLPPAHTGIVVVKDFAGNVLFTTETPK